MLMYESAVPKALGVHWLLCPGTASFPLSSTVQAAGPLHAAEGARATGISVRCLMSISTFMRAERKDIKFPAVGEEIQGSVEGVQNYGVFVKISDDIKAMLHGSEMATKDGREPDIRATFSIGDAIKVRSLCCMPYMAHLGICRPSRLCSHMRVQAPLLMGL